MRRADPPPPTSLEGQFLIAMPSLREGPFARSVVYMCAHRAAKVSSLSRALLA